MWIRGGFGAAMAACVFGFGACMPAPMGDGGNNGGGNGNDNGGDDGLVTLTLRLRSPENASVATLLMVIDDGPQDHASLAMRSPRQDFTFSQFDLNGPGLSEFSQSYPIGTQIALVAIEDPGTATATTFTNPNPVPVFFFQWTGDFVTADVGNPGTLFFTMTEDRTIEAEWRAMSLFTMSATARDPGSNVLISVDVNRLIIPPKAVESGGVSLAGDKENKVLTALFRDGAVMTLEVHDNIDNNVPTCTGLLDGPCFKFVAWTGDCFSQGKSCAVTFGPQTSEAEVILNDVSP